MTQSSHDVVQAFFAAMPAGELTTDVFTPDFAAGSISSPDGGTTAAAYVGAIALVQSLFPERLHYAVEAITAEGNRAVAEVTAQGITADGARYANRYAFVFTIADGRIASIYEFFDPAPVNELIMPRIAEVMAQMQQG